MVATIIDFTERFGVYKPMSPEPEHCFGTTNSMIRPRVFKGRKPSGGIFDEFSRMLHGGRKNPDIVSKFHPDDTVEINGEDTVFNDRVVIIKGRLWDELTKGESIRRRLLEHQVFALFEIIKRLQKATVNPEEMKDFRKETHQALVEASDLIKQIHPEKEPAFVHGQEAKKHE